jgi:hypothetical protein
MGRGAQAITASLLFLAATGTYAFDKGDIRLLGSVTIDAAQGDRIPLPGGTSDDAVSGGQGMGIRAGLELANNEEKTFFTQLFAGYKDSHGPLGHFGESVERAALAPIDTGRYAELTRWTVDLLEQYRFSGNFRFGIGATYHFGLKLTCTETKAGACASIGSASPDNAFGGVAQISYAEGAFEIGVRYTRIDYKLGGQRYDANTFGLFIVLGTHLPR